jgi:heme/copper-type cytochrome/quinol oxidase subunit 3
MKIMILALLAVWLLIGFTVLAVFIGYKAFEYEDLPAYGLDRDKEGTLHVLACLVFWPHAAWEALKVSATRNKK